MNEFYDMHSKKKEKKPVKPYVVEVNKPSLINPKVDHFRLSSFKLCPPSPLKIKK